ncbi:GNAT family N-acetyltransferase [Bacteroidales bacterium OttesenSCG-928-B11]|nr:GNAT family N-acetyltransferase [Bacteroidales bacterium OttesenSCG-928-E04]MDL2311919.1 GNAT family N-acetyltransferase [Bacteroidales bacterium OttesenSCG-928-B11]
MIISDASPYDVDRLIAIADAELGKGYLQRESFLHSVSLPNHLLRVAKFRNGEPAGFCFSFHDNWRIIKEKLQLQRFHHLAQDETSTGVLKTVAVSALYQRKSIGSLLIQDALQELQKRDINFIIGIAWKNGEQVNIGGIFRRHNLHPVGEIANYWTEESLSEQSDCIECGIPCYCTAVIYKLIGKPKYDNTIRR